MYEQDIDPRFGQQVKMIRMRRGMSQERLADAVGLTRTSIANIEGGKQDTTVRRLIRIAQALGVTPARMLQEVR